MHTILRARRILSLASENPARGLAALAAPLRGIDDGVIIARGGRILEVEPYTDFQRRAATDIIEPVTDLGDVTLAPGLINCHTHLELSSLAGKTLLGQGFLPWLNDLVPRIKTAEADEPGRRAAITAAVSALQQSGAAHVGDIITRHPDLVAQAAYRKNLSATLFLECIGHDAQTPTRLMQQADVALFADSSAQLAFSLAGHALYSTPGQTMVRAKAWCTEKGKPFSLHLAEHEDEVECLQTGSGPFADLLRKQLVAKDWQAPRRHPVKEAERLGLLTLGTLAVHCVQCGPEEITTLARSGAAVCLCPRSNAAIGVGEAPVQALAEEGALLALGTDSLASNSDLDLWSEARLLLQKNLLPANALLRMATVNGASALGLSGGLGKLARGHRFCYSLIPDDLAVLF